MTQSLEGFIPLESFLSSNCSGENLATGSGFSLNVEAAVEKFD